MGHFYYDRSAPITEAQRALADEANRAFGTDPEYAVTFAEARQALRSRKNARADRLADGFSTSRAAEDAV